jgi:hypothetical protein
MGRQPKRPPSDPLADLPDEVAAELGERIATAPHMASFWRKSAEHKARHRDEQSCPRCQVETPRPTTIDDADLLEAASPLRLVRMCLRRWREPGARGVRVGMGATPLPPMPKRRDRPRTETMMDDPVTDGELAKLGAGDGYPLDDDDDSDRSAFRAAVAAVDAADREWN